MEAQWTKPLDGIIKELPDNCWIAGGCMRSFLCGEKPKDIDVFTADPDSVIAFLEKKDGFKKSFGNDFFQNFKFKDLTYQVIKKYKYNTPQETIDSFDFTLISAAYGKDGLVLHERFYIDNAQKRLVINALPLPLSTMKRALKYALRGYMLCPVSLSKLVRAINELSVDWENPDQNQIDFYPDGTPTFRGKD
jgi:hypothetical protein